jgi:hypothetical protein
MVLATICANAFATSWSQPKPRRGTRTRVIPQRIVAEARTTADLPSPVFRTKKSRRFVEKQRQAIASTWYGFGDGIFQILSTLWIICRSCGVGAGRGEAGDGMARQTPQWGKKVDVLVSQMEGGGSEGTPAIVWWDEKNE